ncbi:unnamed protein product, partial [Ectocarpus sp. 12 AP-2014]
MVHCVCSVQQWLLRTSNVQFAKIATPPTTLNSGAPESSGERQPLGASPHAPFVGAHTGVMRVAYRRRHADPDGQIPDFLQSEFKSGAWERTGFDVDFPAIAKEPAVAAAIGYTGRNFIGDAMSIRRWYNRDANIMAGSVVFSSGCEGPP